MSANDRLTIEEVETIARNAESQERIAAYFELAVNIKYLAKQLADTMREIEALTHDIARHVTIANDYMRENGRLRSAAESVAKDGTTNQWAAGVLKQALSNKDSDNG